MKLIHPAITVVLATFNGGERLRKTLDSMSAFRFPEGGWKLIVVDNNSTDHTPGIIQEYQEKLPLTKLKCQKRGKNAALNMAIPYFEGGLIVFTDDDVILPTNWLLQFYTVAKNHPEFSVFGGRIIPCWPSTPPTEILEGVMLGDAFAIHESGIPDGEVHCGKIWGPNMAVRASIFHSGFRYNEHIGPTQGRYIPGSESCFNMMLRKYKFKFYFSNSIIVQHQIRPEQFSRKWLMRRAYIFGKGRVVWNQIEGEKSVAKKIGIFPRWYISYLFSSYADYVTSWITANKSLRIKAIWNASIACGMITQTFRISRDLEYLEVLLSQFAA